MIAAFGGAARRSPLEIRPATKADVDAMHAIELASFASPWPKESLYEEIDSRAFTFSVVAVDEGEIAGFMIYWAVADEMHLINLAVAPAKRRRGVAQALMEALFAAARRTGGREILLEVRMSNTGGRALYDGLGFEAIGVRIGYYTDNDEDALVMSLKLDEARCS